MNVFLTAAVMYGITFGIKDAKLFTIPRNWLTSRSGFIHSLLSCAYCVGFHSGWMTYLLMVVFPTDLTQAIRGLLTYAFAGVAVSGALDSILLRIEGSSDPAV
jgi:uncharacterized membrane protein